MHSLSELADRVRRGEPVDVRQLASFFDSPTHVERFLARKAASTLALREAARHQFAAVEAIAHSDESMLCDLADVCRLIGADHEISPAVLRFAQASLQRKRFDAALDATTAAVRLATPANHTAVLAGAYQIACAVARSLSPVNTKDSASGPVRIGILQSALIDGTPAAYLADAVARHADRAAYSPFVYLTETLARRSPITLADRLAGRPSAELGRGTLRTLRAHNVSTRAARCDRLSTHAAHELAMQIADDGIEVLLIDADPADMLAAVVARLSPVDLVIKLARRTPVPIVGHATIAVEGQSLTASPFGILPPLVDQPADPAVLPAVSRKVFGIADDRPLLVTSLPIESERDAWRACIESALSKNPGSLALIAVGDDVRRERDARAAFAGLDVEKQIGVVRIAPADPTLIGVADVVLMCASCDQWIMKTASAAGVTHFTLAGGAGPKSAAVVGEMLAHRTSPKPARTGAAAAFVSKLLDLSVSMLNEPVASATAA